MNFSRHNPSPRYLEVMQLHRRLHDEGERRLGLTPAATYPGKSLFPHVKRIRNLIASTGAQTLLDYGCGKGQESASCGARY